MSKCNQYNRTPDIMFLMGTTVTNVPSDCKRSNRMVVDMVVLTKHIIECQRVTKQRIPDIMFLNGKSAPLCGQQNRLQAIKSDQIEPKLRL